MTDIFDTESLSFGLPRDVSVAVERADFLGFIEQCYFLYSQAFAANNELAIYRALHEAPAKFKRDVICAPCFFAYFQLCLIESCFMNCARPYDANGDLSLRSLLCGVKERSGDFDNRACELNLQRPGFEADKPIRHKLASDEERFYLEEVEQQRKWDELALNLGRPSDSAENEARSSIAYRSPVVVAMTSAELVDLWTKRLSGLNRVTDHLREQRNKIYAHSDFEALNYDALVDGAPITIGDAQKLIDFALDITIELCAIVSGIVWPRKAGNCNDVEGLLNYVNLGMAAADRNLFDID